jgi:hypothetical protein
MQSAFQLQLIPSQWAPICERIDLANLNRLVPLILICKGS